MPSQSKKHQFLQACYSLGFFGLSKRLYRNKLLILCYHGIEARDEGQWWPGVFISGEKFASRMTILEAKGFNVISLDEAVQHLRNNDLPPNSVAITFDDGYRNTVSKVLPVLEKRRFPATVYVTTYYMLKRNPIFRLAVQYMFWKSAKRTISSPLPVWLDAGREQTFDLTNPEERRKAIWTCLDYGEQQCTEQERQHILEELGEILDVSYEAIRESEGLTLMAPEDVKALSEAGVDIQLHTHRHTFPADRDVVVRELEENRTHLQPLVNAELRHFCYPSGKWDPVQHQWLRELGVASATTCELGFNDSRTNPYALKRFLDKEDIPDVEFLAEVSGFLALLRKGRDALRRRGSRSEPRTEVTT